MAQGLLIWDGAGNLKLNITDRITRFVGVYNFSVPPNTSYVPIYISGIANDGTWAACQSATEDTQGGGNVRAWFQIYSGVIYVWVTPNPEITRYGSFLVFRY